MTMKKGKEKNGHFLDLQSGWPLKNMVLDVSSESKKFSVVPFNNVDSEVQDLTNCCFSLLSISPADLLANKVA